MSSFCIPTIRMNSKDDNGFFGLPRIFIWENQKWVKHISCDGSREHVHSYHYVDSIPGYKEGHVLIKCSHKDCITNASDDIQKLTWEKEWQDDATRTDRP